MKIELNGTGGVKTTLAFSNQTPSTPEWAFASQKIDYKAELGELYYLPTLNNGSSLVIGLGEEAKLKLDDLRYVFFKVAKLLIENGEAEVELNIPKLNGMCNRLIARAIGEGFIDASYYYNLSSDPKPPKDLTVHYNAAPGKTHRAEAGLADAKANMAGVFFARDLVNTRANKLYPETLAERARTELSPLGVTVSVYGEEAISEFKMEAFLAVAQGSTNPPRLIVLEYMGDPDSTKVTGLVGKGLTYDSGGYALKPADSMVTMFDDMGGSATVLGTFKTLALRKAKVNVKGVIAACENMISGGAFKNGDVINSRSGKTIEIINTDAEGRLTLADAIHFATTELKVDRVIDLATLTGACLVALGNTYTAAVTNNQEFLDELLEASKEAGEKIWQLPNDAEFAKMNESSVADLKNSGGRMGGTISAGLFVGAFVANDTPWIHLDIAGTAYLDKPNRYLPTGGTGTKVKTLVSLLAE